MSAPAAEMSEPAADIQRPAVRQFGAVDELLGLHSAPGRYVGIGRRVVGQDRHHRAERDVPDLFGQQSRNGTGVGALLVRSAELVRSVNCGSAPEQAPATPGHAHLLVPIMPAAGPATRAPGKDDTNMWGRRRLPGGARYCLHDTL